MSLYFHSLHFHNSLMKISNELLAPQENKKNASKIKSIKHIKLSLGVKLSMKVFRTS